MMSICGYLTVFLMGNLLIGILILLFKSNCFTSQVGVKCLLVATVVIMVRLLIPVELGFEKSFYFSQGLPQFRDLFLVPLFSLGGTEITPTHFLWSVWIIGAILFLLKMTLKSYQFKRSLFNSLLPCSPTALRALAELPRRSRSLFRLQMVQTSRVNTPMITGLFNPTLIIPDISFSEEEWGIILQHELFHYEHHDLWIKLFCEILCALYWWNPLMRILCNQLSKALEIRNDLAITCYMEEEKKVTYLECLLKLVKERTAPLDYSLAFQFASPNPTLLEQRFSLVLDSTPQQAKKLAGRFIPALLTALIVIVLSFSFVLVSCVIQIKG